LRKDKTIERFCDSKKSGNALAAGKRIRPRIEVAVLALHLAPEQVGLHACADIIGNKPASR
jgi:hypothetical protein